MKIKTITEKGYNYYEKIISILLAITMLFSLTAASNITAFAYSSYYRYVRIRTYKVVDGKKVYSKWSKVKTVKTK